LIKQHQTESYTDMTEKVMAAKQWLQSQSHFLLSHIDFHMKVSIFDHRIKERT